MRSLFTSRLSRGGTSSAFCDPRLRDERAFCEKAELRMKPDCQNLGDPKSTRNFLGVLIFAIAATSVCTRPAQACPVFLQGLVSPSLRQTDPQTGRVINNGDLCAFHDRYERARQAILSQGVDPALIADVRAPRLIELPTWTAHTKGWFLHPGNFDPRRVYADPQGKYTVWPNFSAAARLADQTGARNFASLSQGARMTPLSLEDLTVLHIQALGTSEPGVAGRIRGQGLEIGTNLDRSSAPAVTELENLLHFEYPSLLHPGLPLISFRETQCYDQLSPEDQESVGGRMRQIDITSLSATGYDFTDQAGIPRHCGYFIYSDWHEVRPQLDLLFRKINQSLLYLTSQRGSEDQEESLDSTRAMGSQDPLIIAARAQRWFIAIHPFGGGNGRTSRFLMDEILESFGLPPPTLRSMNEDILMTEDQWAHEVAIGMQRVVGILENCTGDLSASRCLATP